MQVASRELTRTFPSREFPKHRPYHSATIVAQYVEPIGEQGLHGVSIHGGAPTHQGRRRREAADTSEAEGAEQTDEQPARVYFPGLHGETWRGRERMVIVMQFFTRDQQAPRQKIRGRVRQLKAPI